MAKPKIRFERHAEDVYNVLIAGKEIGCLWRTEAGYVDRGTVQASSYALYVWMFKPNDEDLEAFMPGDLETGIHWNEVRARTRAFLATPEAQALLDDSAKGLPPGGVVQA